jgi:hypothetical protein
VHQSYTHCTEVIGTGVRLHNIHNYIHDYTIYLFQTHGKIINPEQCKIVFNNNEIGQQVDTELIKSIERVYNEGTEKSFKLLGESISMIT